MKQHKKVQMKRYDIAVVGGGMVGSAVALGFAMQGRTVALIEGQAPTPYLTSQPMDIRVSAISPKSVALLQTLGAWSEIESSRVCPYKRLETWENPECRTRFNAESLNLPQLGYIIENRLVQLGIWGQLNQRENLHLHCPDTLQNIEFQTDSNILTLGSEQQLQADWVIAADGANSNVRSLANIGVTAWDYRQHCMLINVQTDKPQQDMTWQQFTPTGPRSFLPLCGNQASLVWYDSPARIRQLSNLSSAQLRDEILSHFPKELGDISVLDWGAFPLTRRHAQSYVSRRVVLVGDAAHTINPLAGQGVNLGFKDVATLLELTAKADALTEQVFKQYSSKRRGDNLLMQSAMDLFYAGFSNNNMPLRFMRNAALLFAENSGPLKTQVLKYALGI